MQKFRKRQQAAKDRIDTAFGSNEVEEASSAGLAAAPRDDDGLSPELRETLDAARELIANAEKAREHAAPDDRAELEAMIGRLRSAIAERSESAVKSISKELEDLVFYLADA